MTRINLLPWREERRQEEARQFYTVIAMMVVLAAVIIFALGINLNQKLEVQKRRNGKIKQETSNLEVQIKEIDSIKKKRSELIGRMNVIQSLQGHRPVIVRALNELTEIIPNGVYFTRLQKKDEIFTIDGIAESKSRVSNLLRRLDDSPWFAGPNLISIKRPNNRNKQKEEQQNEFILTVKQIAPDLEVTEEVKR